jgi:hypothetical protein
MRLIPIARPETHRPHFPLPMGEKCYIDWDFVRNALATANPWGQSGQKIADPPSSSNPEGPLFRGAWKPYGTADLL